MTSHCPLTLAKGKGQIECPGMLITHLNRLEQGKKRNSAATRLVAWMRRIWEFRTIDESGVLIGPLAEQETNHQPCVLARKADKCDFRVLKLLFESLVQRPLMVGYAVFLSLL